MSIIIIMLVFEPSWSHCPEICDHFRQSFQSIPAQRDCTFIWFLLFSIITLSPVSFAYSTLLPRHQQVIVIMNSEIIGLIRVGFMLCFERRSRYNSLTEWFTKCIQLKNILFCYIRTPICSYLQKLFTAFPYFLFIYSLLSILVYFHSYYENYWYVSLTNYVKIYLQHKIYEQYMKITILLNYLKI